jgi:hypothetical protein
MGCCCAKLDSTSRSGCVSLAAFLWLRFVDGRPVSALTEQFLGWCCLRLQDAGVRVWALVWDNAS